MERDKGAGGVKVRGLRGKGEVIDKGQECVDGALGLSRTLPASASASAMNVEVES